MQAVKFFSWITMLVAGSVAAQSIEITINAINSRGLSKEIGVIKVTDTKYGALFSPSLAGLSSGVHGFHIHQHPKCGSKEKNGKIVAGLAAGGHFDPANAGFHSGPYGEGHQGDLASLYVNEEGKANAPVLAPRVKVSDIKGHSLMIHAGGDNYSDSPKKLGGGGPRVACGVVK